MSHSISFTFCGVEVTGSRVVTALGLTKPPCKGRAREQHGKAEGAKSQIGCTAVAGDSKRGQWEGVEETGVLHAQRALLSIVSHGAVSKPLLD